MTTEKTNKARRWQFSLWTLLLLLTLAAVYVANWRIGVSITELRGELPALRNYARELVIDDRSKFSVVSPHKLWMDDYRWRVYVPDLPIGSSILALRLTDINTLNPDPVVGEPVAVAPLPSGVHTVELKYGKQDDGWFIRVLVDDESVIEQTMSSDWNEARGSRGGNLISRIRHGNEMPIELFRRQFSVTAPDGRSSVPNEAGNGIHLWIDVDNGTGTGDE